MENRREGLFEQGCRDRSTDLLPQSTNADYWKGDRLGRSTGLDEVVRYFPTVEAFLAWRSQAINK
ncbi:MULTISPECIES: hypothetical protein [Cyanophyceae]|uniref:Uncharacterized protein n=1 Tax=Leptolyngbya subtilissima DQ-A4 TaxID=2933933 RepID=A0ABV0KAV9_9CYAN|nr:hypothetical protein [Nodosilinea sp. FACHB-141]MBD2111870.1 hypothetical protein [Nodosilinea sp. FACHB-141]